MITWKKWSNCKQKKSYSISLKVCSVNKYFNFIVGKGCPDIRGTLSNGEIRFDKSLINGQYPVGTRTRFSCNSGYVLDTIGGGRCKENKLYVNADPYWFTFKSPRCKGNQINRPTNAFLNSVESTKFVKLFLQKMVVKLTTCARNRNSISETQTTENHLNVMCWWLIRFYRIYSMHHPQGDYCVCLPNDLTIVNLNQNILF